MSMGTAFQPVHNVISSNPVQIGFNRVKFSFPRYEGHVHKINLGDNPFQTVRNG